MLRWLTLGRSHGQPGGWQAWARKVRHRARAQRYHAQGQDGSDGDDDDDEDGERDDAGGFQGAAQGSTYTDTKTGHAQGQDGSDGDDEDDDDVYPVASLRHGLHHTRRGHRVCSAASLAPV